MSTLPSFIGKSKLVKLLLSSGIVASVVYMAINLFVPMLWPDYNWEDQTVSELSAVGAPTRAIWIPFGALYAAGMILFGYGVRRVARESRTLAWTGMLIMAYGVLSIYWPPMHLRGTQPTLTDTLHLVWAAASILLMFALMGVAADALGRRFRFFTVITIVLMLSFGVLTALQAPNIVTGLPTPGIGLWERLNIGTFISWVISLSVMLLRREGRYRDNTHDRSKGMFASASFHYSSR